MKKLALTVFIAITGALMIWGYYQAIYVAPDDAMQGDIFRIIYYHVPSATVAFLFFAISLARLHRLSRLAPQPSDRGRRSPTPGRWPAPKSAWSSAPSSSSPDRIWGRRAWGIWWTWDARLTTTLVLWLIYVSYLLLRRFAAGPQMQTLAAVLGIFGALDVPIVYMSNRWWRTQHPAPVFGGDADSGMKTPPWSPPPLEHARLACLGRPHPVPPLPRRTKKPAIRRCRGRRGSRSRRLVTSSK